MSYVVQTTWPRTQAPLQKAFHMGRSLGTILQTTNLKMREREREREGGWTSMPLCVACIYTRAHFTHVWCSLPVVWYWWHSLKCVEAHACRARGMNFMLPNVLCSWWVELVLSKVIILWARHKHVLGGMSALCVWNKCVVCKDQACEHSMCSTACGIYGGGALRALYPARISQSTWCVKRVCTVSYAWHELIKAKLMETYHNSIE